MEKKLVPKRRLQGFTGKWDKNKLENLASFSKGKGYSKNDLTDTGHQLILYGRLYTNYETVIKNVDTYGMKQENSILSKGKEVLVPSSGETKEDIARASVIVDPNIIIGGDLNIIIPSKELDSLFLALNISNGLCRRELMKRAQGSSVVHLYNEDLISVTLYFPSVKEQQKIGEFFKVLDERISNQERKIAKVKALKDAYLTEMFPQEGETVPKRRFKGFEGEWSEKEFNELGAFGRTYSFSRSKEGVGKYHHIHYGDIHTKNLGIIDKRCILPMIKEEESFELAKQGDIVIADASEDYKDLGKSVVIGDTTNRKIIAGLHTFKFTPNEKLYPIYYLYYSQTRSFKKFSYKTGTGISVFGISKDNLGKMKLYIPTLEEQQKIGNFFKNLDNQIETEEKKLDKLQKMKEAYLEEMFV